MIFPTLLRNFEGRAVKAIWYFIDARRDCRAFRATLARYT